MNVIEIKFFIHSAAVAAAAEKKHRNDIIRRYITSERVLLDHI